MNRRSLLASFGALFFAPKLLEAKPVPVVLGKLPTIDGVSVIESDPVVLRPPGEYWVVIKSVRHENGQLHMMLENKGQKIDSYINLYSEDVRGAA